MLCVPTGVYSLSPAAMQSAPGGLFWALCPSAVQMHVCLGHPPLRGFSPLFVTRVPIIAQVPRNLLSGPLPQPRASPHLLSSFPLHGAAMIFPLCAFHTQTVTFDLLQGFFRDTFFCLCTCAMSLKQATLPDIAFHIGTRNMVNPLTRWHEAWPAGPVLNPQP